jgi:hypothetical protein
MLESMADPNDLSDAIRDAANAPRRTKVKSTEVEERDIADLIAAERHLANKAAANRNHQGLRFTKIIPPGCG